MEVIVTLPEVQEKADASTGTEDLVLPPCSSRETFNKTEEGLTTILETASDFMNAEDEKKTVTPASRTKLPQKIHEVTMSEEQINESMMEDSELRVKSKEIDTVLEFGAWNDYEKSELCLGTGKYSHGVY